MIRQLGGSAIVYAVSNGVSSAAQLFIFLICAYILPPTDFGILSLFIVSVSLGTQLLGLGLVAAFQREFYNPNRDFVAVYLSSIIFFIFTISAFSFLLSILLTVAASTIANLPTSIFIFAVIASFGQAIQQFLLVAWQSEGKRMAYLKYMLMFCLFQVVVPVSFFFWIEGTWHAVIYGQTLVLFCGGIISLILLFQKKYLVPKLDRNGLVQSLSYALPLVPHQLAGWGMAMLDRFLITSFCGAAVAGYYSLAFQVAQMINIVSGGFNQAFAPWLYSRMSSPESLEKNKIRNVVLIYAAIILMTSLGGYLLFALFIHIFPSEAYQRALPFAPWLFFAMMLNGLYRISSNFILYRGNTTSLAMMTMGSALSSFILNYTLVPIYGAVAAGWVVSFSFFMLFLLSTILVLYREVMHAD